MCILHSQGRRVLRLLPAVKYLPSGEELASHNLQTGSEIDCHQLLMVIPGGLGRSDLSPRNVQVGSLSHPVLMVVNQPVVIIAWRLGCSPQSSVMQRLVMHPCRCTDESIDEVAEFLGVGDKVAQLTKQ